MTISLLELKINSIIDEYRLCTHNSWFYLHAETFWGLQNLWLRFLVSSSTQRLTIIIFCNSITFGYMWQHN